MQTIEKKVHDLKEGEVVAVDVYTDQLQLLISTGSVLTEREIARLIFYGIRTVTVKVPEAQLSESPTADHIHQDDIALFYAFKSGFTEATGTFKNMMRDLLYKGDKIKEEELLSLVKHVMQDIPSNIKILDMLKNMRDCYDVIFAHSMCVALLCHVFGNWLNWSDEKRDVLILSALLHDVGKMEVSEEILNKQGKLSEEEFAEIKKHPIYGYYLLKNQDIDERIKRVALMHHERNDGTGYPKGLKETEIDEMASVVAIADVFDAMTSCRPYRKGICPFTVIDILRQEGNTKLNYAYVHKFIERISYSYMNENVKLSNGMEGEIVAINDMDFSRPMVRVNGEIINLSRNYQISIAEVIPKWTNAVGD